MVGIDFDAFKHGVPEGNKLHLKLLKKLFEECDSRKAGILDWPSFLQAMIVLWPSTLSARIDSVLNLIYKKYKKA